MLDLVPGIGPARLRALVTRFKDPLLVRVATVREIAAVPGFSPKLAAALGAALRGIGRERGVRDADRRLRLLHACGGSVVHLWDSAYPRLLAGIFDPPPLLYYRGRLDAARGPAVAVVGTRRATPYGLAAAELLARDLSASGVAVVSGLARGIDTRAHEAALGGVGGTIAVTGTGLDRCYPRENRRLAERVASEGVLVTEFPPDTGPEPGNFPRRNRIISGLSRGTIVIESDLDGGAMITAAMALDQNRESFAVPGPVHSRMSRGPHALIREGRAKLIETAADVLVEIVPGWTAPAGAAKPAAALSLTPPEKNIFARLGHDPVHVDDLAERAGVSAGDLLVLLLSLEMKNLARQHPGKYFTRPPGL